MRIKKIIINEEMDMKFQSQRVDEQVVINLACQWWPEPKAAMKRVQNYEISGCWENEKKILKASHGEELDWKNFALGYKSAETFSIGHIGN